MNYENKIIAIMPYFAQENKAWPRYTPHDMNLPFIKATIASLVPYVNICKVYIGCQNDDDYKDLMKAGLEMHDLVNINIEIIKLDCVPHHLTLCTLQHIQTQIKNDKIAKTEFYLYAESDQIFNFGHVGLLQDMLRVISENKDKIFVSPHRYDQIDTDRIALRLKKYNTPNTNIVHHNSKFTENNNVYVVSNHLLYDEIFEQHNKSRFYINHNVHSSYGGGWICHQNLFENLDFSPKTPFGENAGGNLLFNHKNSISLKTINYHEFFVEHLSGYYFNKYENFEL